MKATSNSTMGFEVYLQVSEVEARALDALVGYGYDDFLKVFYQHLGKHYMQPHEAGLKSLFETVRAEIPKHLSRIDKTREAFKENNPNK